MALGQKVARVDLVALARCEFIADITIDSQNKTYKLPTGSDNLPNERFMSGLRLEFEGRYTNPATGGPTAVIADAPWSILELIKVGGYHRTRKRQEDFIFLRGRELYELNRLYGPVGAGVGAALAPITTILDNGAAAAALVVTASHTNDFAFVVDIPFTPLGLSRTAQMRDFLLDCPNYDNLCLTIQTGDDKSLFSGQTTAPTATAYGSATGSPRIRVSGLYAISGAQRFQNFVPARVYRTFSEVTSGDIVSGASEARLFNLSKGYALRGLLLKSGVKASAGANNVYASVSDTILTKLNVNYGMRRPIRAYPSMRTIQAEKLHGLRPSSGYGLIDFAPNGDANEALRTQGMVGGPSGDVDLYVSADIAAGANQAALLVSEELRHVAYVRS